MFVQNRAAMAVPILFTVHAISSFRSRFISERVREILHRVSSAAIGCLIFRGGYAQVREVGIRNRIFGSLQLIFGFMQVTHSVNAVVKKGFSVPDEPDFEKSFSFSRNSLPRNLENVLFCYNQRAKDLFYQTGRCVTSDTDALFARMESAERCTLDGQEEQVMAICSDLDSNSTSRKKDSSQIIQSWLDVNTILERCKTQDAERLLGA